MGLSVARVLLWSLALIIGLLLVPVRLVVSFFPLFNVAEVILFGGVCLLLARVFKAKTWVWGLLVAGPTCVLVVRILNRLGFESLSHGIGTGHALSLVLIPLAACLGAIWGVRLARKRAGLSAGPSQP